MTKLFNVVGVSRVRAGAALKLRVANGKPERRARILDRNGHADVMLVAVPNGVSKADAFAFLQTNYPALAAQIKVKAPKATETVATATAPAVQTPEEKLAAKRAKDAARKREKRAAEKAAKLAAAA